MALGQFEQERLIRCFQVHASEEAAGQDANRPAADRLRQAIWQLTGLLRVYSRHDRKVDDEPFALPIGATIAEVADEIHHELGAECAGALVWDRSARFEGQRVGRAHVVADGDIVEIIV